MLVALWTLTSCAGRPRVDSPTYQDPMADTTPFEQAEEYQYLVDLETAKERLTETAESMEDVLGGETEGMPSPAAMLGDLGLEQEEIIAEANETMVHARGTYMIPGGDESFLAGLAEAGPAEVELPAHFPADRWMGDVFLANPGELIEMGFIAMEKSLAEIQESMPDFGGQQEGQGFNFGIEFLLGMYGVGSAEDIYGWMGSEMHIATIVNPDYDPDQEPSAENVPWHTIMAISSSRPDQGLDLIEDFFTGPLMGMLGGMDVSRDEIEGYDAVIVPAPDFANSFMSEMYTEEQLEMIADAPETAAVAVPGYLFLADEPSILAALEVFEPNTSGTGRLATMEAEWNWDLTVDYFSPTNPGLWIGMLESEELQDLLMEFYIQTKDLEELGASRATVIVPDNEHFELDIMTSRESIRLFEIVKGIVEETPEEIWEALGEQFAEWLQESSGMGGLGGPGMGGFGRN